MTVARLGWTVALLGMLGAAMPVFGDEPSVFTIDAHDFDRGNVRVSQPGEMYATRYACVWNAGEYPNLAEYDLEFPVDGEYSVHVLYTAADSRPVELLVDQKPVHTGIAGVTGSWNTDQARWERQCAVRLGKGRHTISLRRREFFPHICALRFECSEPFPPGWELRRPDIELRRAREARRARAQASLAAIRLIDPAAMRRAVDDLISSFPDRFVARERAQARLDALVRLLEDARLTLERFAAEPESADDGAFEALERKLADLRQCQRDLLLANPLLDFDHLLVVNRGATAPNLGLPQNWQGNAALPTSGFDDEIARLDWRDADAPLVRIHKPDASVFVGDVDLDYGADKLLFSSIGTHDRWQVFEIGVDGRNRRQVTAGEDSDVDNYDACYLPDGRIVFSSNRSFCSVACVNGSTRVANLYSMTPDGGNIRQLCFDQEHNWCPTVAHDGSVLYTRWEYTDTPHTHSRILFRMNPDGTRQTAVYGANSYWPNAMYFTRPVPGDPSKLLTIVSGHHGVPRMGELILLDPLQGSQEADGVVQRIPGFGQTVEPKIEDQLVDDSWPKFLHPWPLSDRYYLVACKPSPTSLWGIYLADRFDNLVLIKETPGRALLEPIPLRARPRPPVIPDAIDLARKDSVVYVADVHAGPGLAGIPRGTVKKLRLFTYTYDYPGMGGPQGVVGLEGPWDVRRILGTVPVETDGSAAFRVPANTPISVQPLDEQGRALQIMRSWFTGMPGEVVTCNGCHDRPGAATSNRRTRATPDAPAEITPWYGPARGFSFEAEVQPVLDRYCVDCHQGEPDSDGRMAMDLRGDTFITDYDSRYHHGGQDAGRFSAGYANLQRFVRRPGLESDFHLLSPMDFHANTTTLVQRLEAGHYGVALDAESWDRLATWIDLNAPFHGSWTTIAGAERVVPLAKRRREMLVKYAGVDYDAEATGSKPSEPIAAVRPAPSPPRGADNIERPPGWPFDEPAARDLQSAAAKETVRRIDLGDGLALELVLIPAGAFILGDDEGLPNEGPASRVSVAPFWMGRFEVTNEQYERFDRFHDSRHEVRHAMQFGVQGWPLNDPRQPVVRVSWNEARAFCEWLAERTDMAFDLPSEAQWEYACRAGTATAYHFGGADSDFSPFANLADQKLRDSVSDPYRKEIAPLSNPTKYDDWIPRSDRYHDGYLVTAPVGSYRPNAWGLHDMHGNVWEWTTSPMRPYPYREVEPGSEPSGARGVGGDSSLDERVARGGSWRDVPELARASSRIGYRPYQRVYNVGFRVVAPGAQGPSPTP